MWSQGSSKYRKQKKCTCSEIPINLSFYVYIIPKETNILQIKIKKKRKWLNFLNWSLKIYIRIISIILISIQVLIPDFVFPVYKIDREQSPPVRIRFFLSLKLRTSVARTSDSSNRFWQSLRVQASEVLLYDFQKGR